ncbi:MAG TPA: GTPase ObgE [Acidimicrobiales bacterium]|nr:GTPase ObgE [Acidimicrobiales bacterium]
MAGFVDEAQVHVKAGNGGAGAVSFRREAHVSRGGPDGGDGGNGGSVFLEASTSAVSLLAFRDHPHRRAEDGTHGGGGRRHGRNGRDLVVPVPEGTLIRTLDGAVLADLARAGDRLLAAGGGRGGRGNTRFLTNRLRAPAFAEQGEVGEERWLDLELKLLADVALVGFPNAGKSTLISRISAAKPKIADYPFTTLEPHLGVVRTGGHGPGGRGEGAAEYVVADIPGLVEGASEGRGLGFQFLRHVERARVLVILIDLGADAGRPPAEQARVLLHELGRFRPELLERPRLVVGSRADLVAPDDRLPLDAYGGAQVISAVTGEGLGELTGRLASLVARAGEEVASRAVAPVLHRPEAEGVAVERDGGAFVVLGREAARAVAVSDLTDPDAIAHVQRRLKRMGVDRALARAGAREGDEVRIGALTFTYSPDA